MRAIGLVLLGIAIMALLLTDADAQRRSSAQGSQAAGHTVGRRILVLSARTQSEIDAAFARLVEQQAGGLLINTMHFSSANAIN